MYNEEYLTQLLNKDNNSGQGKGIELPNEIKNRFNWGAFLLGPFWGIGNNSYITFTLFLSLFLALIPLIGTIIPAVLSYWFGVEGNKWAWENKRFKSVAAFQEYQKKWAIAGTIYSVITFAVIIYVAMISVNSIMNSGLDDVMMRYAK